MIELNPSFFSLIGIHIWRIISSESPITTTNLTNLFCKMRRTSHKDKIPAWLFIVTPRPRAYFNSYCPLELYTTPSPLTPASL